MTLKIIPSGKSLSSPLGELAMFNRTPEYCAGLDHLRMLLSAVTVKVLLVHELSAITGWMIAPERSRMRFIVTASKGKVKTPTTVEREDKTYFKR
jgi:hypothetical protein